MSERKVLNKYYPPDFDPAKIPRLHLPKDRQYTVEVQSLRCDMTKPLCFKPLRCKTCGEYIYKGKKFNARKETVQGEEYLGLKIFRFYIKCTRCLAEITFKTDPQNADYVVEHGATRNFQALKLAEEQAEREQAEREEEEAGNPMKLLESRTKASKLEMDVIEGLEELRDLQERHANVDYEKMLTQYAIYEEQLRKRQEDEDEAFVRKVFGKNEDDVVIKRISDDDSDEEPRPVTSSTVTLFEKASDILTEEPVVGHVSKKSKTSDGKNPSSSKSFLAGLVRPKPAKISQRMATEETALSLAKPSTTSLVDRSQSREVQNCAPTTTGLGLIGAYGDDSDESDS